MKDSLAIIQKIRRVSAQTIYLELAVEDEGLKRIKAGHSLLVRLLDADSDDVAASWHPYLREQWWPVGFTKNEVLVVERPFSHKYQPGQPVRVLGPVGNPFRFRKSLRNVLLIAYNESPIPLTIMTAQLLKNQISVTLVLLGAAKAYQTDHLAAEIEVIRGGDTLDWPELVMTLGWADQVFVVVGQDDEAGRFAEVRRLVEEKRTTIPSNYLFGVFQPPQPCGTGACSACMLRVGRELVPVCTQGPAFDLTTVQL